MAHAAQDLSLYPFVESQTQRLPYAFVKKRGVLPLGEEGGRLLLALSDPYDLETLEEVRCLLRTPLVEVLASAEAIEAAIERCYHQKEDAASQLIASLSLETPQQQEEGEGYDLLDRSEGSPVIQILNAILKEAIGQGASDIHFEPNEEGVRLRYRLDGVLQDVALLPEKYSAAGKPLIVMLPFPFVRRTRAVALLRRPSA